MSGVPQILVSALAAAALLVACGQKGPLVLPSGEAAAGRATLPQTLAPSTSAVTPTPAASQPPTGTAVPAPRP
ncbi:LPS translocon maturation chaperone LptM [Ramlibacter sp. AN1133]|uniref:LPS translocon maturation chaperone LptM n=1 Tax=Ramlibacter sp. AN1133 TaxID=3133429 RepID=UPI0030C1C657